MLKLVKKFKFLILLISLVIITATIWYWKKTADIGKKRSESAFTVKKRNLTEELTLSGKIQAEESLTLRFQTAGRLNWAGVKVGDSVKKYQAIAALDLRDVQKNLEKKLNTYMSERWDFEQTHQDYGVDGNPIADAHLTDEEKRIVEKAQFDLNNAVLEVELYDLSVKYATLTTPIDGIVTNIDTPNAGVNITPATANFQITNPDTLYFSVIADQSEVVDLTMGMPAEIILDPDPETTITSKISYISFTPKTGETSTVYEVKLPLLMSAAKIPFRLEMTGDATFIINKKNSVLAIPVTYAFSEKNRTYVKMYVNGKDKKVYIKTGDEIDDYVIVIDGLSEGDIIYD